MPATWQELSPWWLLPAGRWRRLRRCAGEGLATRRHEKEPLRQLFSFSLVCSLFSSVFRVNTHHTHTGELRRHKMRSQFRVWNPSFIKGLKAQLLQAASNCGIQSLIGVFELSPTGFELFEVLPTPQFSFGGRSGNSVAALVFQKT